MKNTIQDLNVYLTPKQKGIVNSFLEENPLLAAIPVKPASHGIYNVYAKTSSVDDMQEVDFDAELPTIGISFELGQTRLGKIGGTLAIPQDAATEMGGYARYLADRMPPILSKSGNTQESRIYYKGFLKKAIDTGNVVSAGGTSAGKQFSMVAVHFDMDSTVGLYNPKTVGNAKDAGSLFVTQALNNGAVYKVKDLNYALGKEVATWMQFGLQLADDRYVKAIVNIEPKANATDKEKIDGMPTAMQIDDLINDVRGNSANTIIFCNPIIRRYLGIKYELEKRMVTAPNGNIAYEVFSWNGVQFVTSYNIFNGTESVVSL
jgi:hypothetical protein